MVEKNYTLKKTTNDAIVESYADYYPFGEQLPGRNFTSSLLYKYAYQGQEHDEETGLDAFELRLWDGRIGRWLSTDPYGQYHSPYLGMGNNPVNLIDRTGGSADPPSTDVRDLGDGNYEVVGGNPYDNDNNIYVVDNAGKRTGEIIGQTENPFDFFYSDEKLGTFKGFIPVTFNINSLVNGNTIFNNITNYFKKNAIGGLSGISLMVLAIESKNTGRFDIKSDPKYSPSQAVSYNGKITTVRSLSNIIFGYNMRSVHRGSFDTQNMSAIDFFKSYMPYVGAYNQYQNDANTNSEFPYYGEHPSSGSNIIKGFFK